MLQSRIARRYWLILAGFIALAAIAFGLVQGAFVYRGAKLQAERLQATELQTVIAQIDGGLDSVVDSLVQVCRMPWSSSLVSAFDQRLEFQRLLKRYPELVEVRGLSEKGMETAFVARVSLDRVGSGFQGDMPLGHPGRTALFGKVFFRDELAPHVMISCREREGGTGAATMAEMNLEFISEAVGESGRRLSGDAFVVDEDRRLIAHSRSVAVFSAGDAATLGADRLEPSKGDVSTRWAGGFLDGALVSSAPMRIAPWRLAVSQPLKVVLAPALYSVAATLAVALALAGVAAGIALWLASYLTVPIRSLRKAVAATADGDLTSRVQPQTSDELGDLARDFNRMADQLQDYTTGLERKVTEKTVELETANRHKSEFLANMSHELRTPLNAVIGFSDVLSEKMFGDLNEKQLEYVRDINASGQHLLSLINDILDLSKIAAGRMELDPRAFNVATALDNCRTLIRERARGRGLRLSFGVPDNLGEWTGDERKFKQIVLNLLSNAVKFTPPGGEVSLAARFEPDALVLTVSDTGPGIAPKDQAAIFEEFRQLKVAHDAKHEGTGLGLALTRRLVELHGGSIRVESAMGRGASFIARFPLASPTPAGA